jgi:hypothetical protein
MSRKKIEEKVRKKEQEIQELEAQLRDARTYLQALQDVLKMMPRDDGQNDPDVIIRPGSSVDETRQIILTHGKPLHITDILKAMGREPTRENRSSLSGSLAAYVRRNEIFTRPMPNTFGLVELSDKAVDAPTIHPPIPSSFGRIPDDGDMDESDY